MSGTIAPTAAVLVIGNELLSGKIREANVSVLARELFELGVELRRVVFCPDEVEGIVEDLDALRHRHDWVFTSGGVGPTHDDVTIAAVARAFGRKVVRCERLEELLREVIGDDVTEHHLRMALVPEGTELVVEPGGRWPTLLLENVFILPGLPEVFRHKVPAIRERVGAGPPFVSRFVCLSLDEGRIAGVLEELSGLYPDVQIGSYPTWSNPEYRVKVTVDGRDDRRVSEVLDEVRARVPRDSLVEVPE